VKALSVLQMFTTQQSASIAKRLTANESVGPTVAAFDEAACPSSVSHQSVPQFGAEQCSPDCQRISPTSES